MAGKKQTDPAINHSNYLVGPLHVGGQRDDNDFPDNLRNGRRRSFGCKQPGD
ncbi:MAG: hypothetical protein ACFN0Y_00190 [Lactobacillus sp.]